MGVHVRKKEFPGRHNIIEGRTEKITTMRITNGIKTWETIYTKPKITTETCVAVFHGRPLPNECMEDPLVADNWRI
jgi:hypothetical protein